MESEPRRQAVGARGSAGIVDAVGSGVAGIQAGDRVWVTLAGDGHPASGTAQEYTPSCQPNVSFGSRMAPLHRAPVVGRRRR